MKQKLIVAFATAVLIIGVAISIAAHCGSTWVVQAPSFGPALGPNGCTADSNPTTTSKSVSTTIHWTVGPPGNIVVTDSGQNKLVGGLLSSSCVRCFPIFEAPQWVDLGDGVTHWRQQTYQQVVSGNNTCVVTSRDPIIITLAEGVIQLVNNVRRSLAGRGTSRAVHVKSLEAAADGARFILSTPVNRACTGTLERVRVNLIHLLSWWI